MSINEDKFRESINKSAGSQPQKLDYYESLDQVKIPVAGSFVKARRRKKLYVRITAIAASFLLVSVGLISANSIGLFDGNNSGVNFRGVSAVSPVEISVADNDYANVYKIIKKSVGNPVSNFFGNFGFGGLGSTDSASDSTVAGDGGDIAPQGKITVGEAPLEVDDPEYSETNIQTEGVQEADVIKTDGKYIYTISDEYLYILTANDGHPSVTGKINNPSKNGEIYSEMYISGDDRLIALREIHDTGIGNGTVNTCVDIFDIRDKSAPKKLNTLSQSGYYHDSRMIGDKLYLISTFSDFYAQPLREGRPETYVPTYCVGDKETIAKAKDINILPDTEYPSYTLVSGIDTGKKGDFVSKKSVLGDSSTVYASLDNIYIMVNSYGEDTIENAQIKTTTYQNKTTITRVAIDDGKVSVEATAAIPGVILNQFSLDEKDDVLRVVTTYSKNTYTEYKRNTPQKNLGNEDLFVDSDLVAPNDFDGDSGYTSSLTNNVYTLDMNLKQFGSIENLAPDEQVYSCRFLGDTAYFVTFRNTDPLFSVDLSDPTAPKLLGALKIPGFSEYLHPYTDNLLFGFGNDADETTGAIKGMKLSMFDMSNPADVKEVHKLVIEGYTDSEASYNHKAILVDARKNLIAFPTDDGGYYVYTYDDSVGFSERVKVKLNPELMRSPEEIVAYEDEYGSDVMVDEDWWMYMNPAIRGIFIGDYFYIVCPYGVSTYDMSADFAKVSELKY